jgi:hypothetical protein
MFKLVPWFVVTRHDPHNWWYLFASVPISPPNSLLHPCRCVYRRNPKSLDDLQLVYTSETAPSLKQVALEILPGAWDAWYNLHCVHLFFIPPCSWISRWSWETSSSFCLLLLVSLRLAFSSCVTTLFYLFRFKIYLVLIGWAAIPGCSLCNPNWTKPFSMSPY